MTRSLPGPTRQSPGLGALLLLVLGLAALAAPAASAAVYTPTTTADTLDGACNAQCSLREAIVAANANPGSDVVILGPGVYALTRAGAGEDLAATGDLDVTDDLVVLGAGAAQTIIDAGDLDRAFEVIAVRLEISAVTVQNGLVAGPGGGLRNRGGELQVSRSVVRENATVGEVGGGIESDGALTVTQTTVLVNMADGNGGGLAVRGELALVNSTVFANRSVNGFGGGIYVFADVAGAIANATIASNTAFLRGGGAFVETAAFIGVTPAWRNTILAGNSAPTDRDCSGSAHSEGHNLVGVGTGCADFSAAHVDIVGTAATPIDPLLAPLANNGGPTPTLHPLPPSPAIDTGDPAPPGSGGTACEAVDQRGASRPGGIRCDIGAVEVTLECLQGGDSLCLEGGRFRASARFTTPQGFSGDAHAVQLTDDAGYFWFFAPENLELTLKVVNACAPPFNRFWVFLAGLTNVQVQVTVTDTKTGAVKTYNNPQGQAFRTRLDTQAFATCP